MHCTDTPVTYVTFTEDGALDGAYHQQIPDAAHLDRMIEVDDEVIQGWVHYRANSTRDGVELAADSTSALASVKQFKKREIAYSWNRANMSSFPFDGYAVACDSASRHHINDVANHVAMFGCFPPGFAGSWKAVDNSLIPMESVETFKAMCKSLSTYMVENFHRAQSLKEELASATTVEEVEAISWL